MRLDAQRDPLNLPGTRQADGNGRGPSSSRQEPPQAQVGFGQGLSIQGAALRTINTTIELTRRTMPTIEEIRQRFIIASSTRRNEAQRAASEQTERMLTRQAESRIPEASAQVQRFVSDVEENAGEEQVRLGGSGTEDEATAPAVQFNDEQIGLSASETEATSSQAPHDEPVRNEAARDEAPRTEAPRNQPRLDVRV